MEKKEVLVYNFIHTYDGVKRDGNSDAFHCLFCSCSYKSFIGLKKHVLKSHINRAYIKPSDKQTFGQYLKINFTSFSSPVAYVYVITRLRCWKRTILSDFISKLLLKISIITFTDSGVM